MALPIVYCETNWLVALAFPHHQRYAAAIRLLGQARDGQCALRVPLAAFVEAQHPITEFNNSMLRSFAQLRDDIARAYQNGHDQFRELHVALTSSTLDHYTQRETLRFLQDLERDTVLSVLPHDPHVIQITIELRSRVHLRAKDVVDLYMLAAIIADRRSHADGPAIFFSLNSREFLNDAKVPEQVYLDEKLLCRDDFDLRSAVGAWNAKYGLVRSV